MVTVAERRKLDTVFTAFQLFSEREWPCAAEASWAGGLAFLRRGPLLIFGNWRYQGIFVITPFHADTGEIEIRRSNLTDIHVEVLQEGGQAIRIWEYDEGEWWDFLRQEIPRLEQWVKELVEEHNRRSGRDALLKEATQSVQMVQRFGDLI